MTISHQKFWEWFKESRSEIEGYIKAEDSSALSKMARKGLSLLDGDLGWEFGPSKAGYFFAISANGDREKFSFVKSILATAPKLRGWTFLYGRPRREWNFQFELINAKGNSISIDASAWRYTLTSFNNGEFFDVELYCPDLKTSSDTLQQAGWTVLIGALGENLVDGKIGKLKVVQEKAPKLSGCIVDLFSHLNSLCNP